MKLVKHNKNDLGLHQENLVELNVIWMMMMMMTKMKKMIC